jgi:hypothetical protein
MNVKKYSTDNSSGVAAFWRGVLMLACFLWVSDARSQHTLKGNVIESMSRIPVISAHVVVKGTQNYSITDFEGRFVLKNLPTGQAQITISYTGFKTLDTLIQMTSDVEITLELEEDVKLIYGAQVSGVKDKISDESARSDERKAHHVLNIISARSIELSPDLTVANITQRVSGVSLERNNNGDGQHAIVRGMDKRYNYTLVNGIKIPSPDPKNRYVPLDIFPSDLLDRLVVSKALLPNMEGDAIGGVMDLKMKDAPGELYIMANIGTGFNTLFLDRDYQTFDRQNVSRKSPQQVNGIGYRAVVEDFPYENIDFSTKGLPFNSLYSVAVGNRNKNKKWGGIIAGSYQNTFRGANSMFMTTFIDQSTNLPYYEIMQKRQFSTEQVRSGIHTKFDYNNRKGHKIELYSAYVNLQARENRSRVDTILKIGRGQGPGTGRVEIRERSRQEIQQIYNTTLQGTHEWNRKFKTDWSLVYSIATNDDPDMAEIKWLTGVTLNNTTGQYSYEPVLYDRDFTRRWQNNKDADLALYWNNTYTPIRRLELSAGVMGRLKGRESHFNSFLFRTSPIRQEWSGQIRDYTFTLFNNIGTPTDPLNYASSEEVTALYGMFRWMIMDNLQAMGGVRRETTLFEWVSNAPPTVRGRVGSISYQDMLPSLHIKYAFLPKHNLRTSYFKSISRPSFFEVIPYEINEDDFRERGNPFLQRTIAHNFDLRYEYFPTPLDQFMIGFFTKEIINPIESALAIHLQTMYLQPNNFGVARNSGIEVDLTKYIGQFGFRGFYTYTLSEITTSKIVRFRDNNGNLTSREELQTRPLQGQSRHISNVSLLYKNSRIGLDLQLAMVYTGERIISVSPYLDNDIWQRGFVQLDFSGEKKIKKQFFIYAKINNLLNTPLLADIRLPNTFNPEQAPYIDSSKSVLVREDFYRQTIILGLKYKL